MLQAARNTIVTIVLVGLVALTWLMGRPPAPAETPLRTAAGDEASYLLKDATLYRTDSDGRIVYRIRAESAERSAEGGPLELAGLTLAYDPAAEIGWQLSAGTGAADDTLDVLELGGGVRLESGDIDGHGTTTITAENMTFDADASMATTPGPISLARGDTRFEATGLTADLSRDRIDLHSDVSARLAQ